MTDRLKEIREQVKYYKLADIGPKGFPALVQAIGDIEWLLNYIDTETVRIEGFISSHAVPGGKK